MNGIVLCSGGLDSVVTAFYVKKQLGARKMIILFFNYRQKSLLTERKYAKLCAAKLNAKFVEFKLDELAKLSTSLINKNGKVKSVKRRDLKNTIQSIKDWYVPFRNTLFISYALALAESLLMKNGKKYDIFTGFKNEGREAYPDTTKEYLKKINELQKTAGGKFSVKAPLIDKDKEDIVLLGRRLGVDFSKTHSCYISNRHCGYCLACRLRQEGFYLANVKDATSYKIKIQNFIFA